MVFKKSNFQGLYFGKLQKIAKIRAPKISRHTVTFLVMLNHISGEFGRAMVCILARRSRAKIPMVRPNEPDMLPKRTKKGAIWYLPHPKSALFFQLP